MAYNLGWSSQHPGHLVYLVDLSESMKENGKIEKAMDALRNRLRNHLTRCIAGSLLIERFTVTIIGYHSHIVPLFSGGVQELHSLFREAISMQKPLFNYDEGGIAEPKGYCCMSKAFNEAKKVIEQWIGKSNGRECPAPIVVNISNGQPEEEGKSHDIYVNETLQAAKELTRIGTSDGNALLFNVYVGETSNSSEILFPVKRPDSTGNINEDNRISFLFECSSTLPDLFVKAAMGDDVPVHVGSHGMVSIHDVDYLRSIVPPPNVINWLNLFSKNEFNQN